MPGSPSLVGRRPAKSVTRMGLVGSNRGAVGMGSNYMLPCTATLVESPTPGAAILWEPSMYKALTRSLSGWLKPSES